MRKIYISGLLSLIFCMSVHASSIDDCEFLKTTTINPTFDFKIKRDFEPLGIPYSKWSGPTFQTLLDNYTACAHKFPDAERKFLKMRSYTAKQQDVIFSNINTVMYANHLYDNFYQAVKTADEYLTKEIYNERFEKGILITQEEFEYANKVYDITVKNETHIKETAAKGKIEPFHHSIFDDLRSAHISLKNSIGELNRQKNEFLATPPALVTVENKKGWYKAKYGGWRDGKLRGYGKLSHRQAFIDYLTYIKGLDSTGHFLLTGDQKDKLKRLIREFSDHINFLNKDIEYIREECEGGHHDSKECSYYLS